MLLVNDLSGKQTEVSCFTEETTDMYRCLMYMLCLYQWTSVTDKKLSTESIWNFMLYWFLNNKPKLCSFLYIILRHVYKMFLYLIFPLLKWAYDIYRIPHIYWICPLKINIFYNCYFVEKHSVFFTIVFNSKFKFLYKSSGSEHTNWEIISLIERLYYKLY